MLALHRYRVFFAQPDSIYICEVGLAPNWVCKVRTGLATSDIWISRRFRSVLVTANLKRLHSYVLYSSMNEIYFKYRYIVHYTSQKDEPFTYYKVQTHYWMFMFMLFICTNLIWPVFGLHTLRIRDVCMVYAQFCVSHIVCGYKSR